jgi:hypothetical protein
VSRAHIRCDGLIVLDGEQNASNDGADLRCERTYLTATRAISIEKAFIDSWQIPNLHGSTILMYLCHNVLLFGNAKVMLKVPTTT